MTFKQNFYTKITPTIIVVNFNVFQNFTDLVKDRHGYFKRNRELNFWVAPVKKTIISYFSVIQDWKVFMYLKC